MSKEIKEPAHLVIDPNVDDLGLYSTSPMIVIVIAPDRGKGLLSHLQPGMRYASSFKSVCIMAGLTKSLEL